MLKFWERFEWVMTASIVSSLALLILVVPILPVVIIFQTWWAFAILIVWGSIEFSPIFLIPIYMISRIVAAALGLENENDDRAYHSSLF